MGSWHGTIRPCYYLPHSLAANSGEAVLLWPAALSVAFEIFPRGESIQVPMISLLVKKSYLMTRYIFNDFNPQLLILTTKRLSKISMSYS